MSALTSFIVGKVGDLSFTGVEVWLTGEGAAVADLGAITLTKDASLSKWTTSSSATYTNSAYTATKEIYRLIFKNATYGDIITPTVAISLEDNQTFTLNSVTITMS